jgi:hypothetical protein
MIHIQKEHLKRFGEYLTANKWWDKKFLDFSEDEIKSFMKTTVYITGTWPVDIRIIINWLNKNELPQEFPLYRYMHINNGPLFRQRLLEDIAAGPVGPRAQYGALQADLRAIYALFGPKGGSDEVPF